MTLTAPPGRTGEEPRWRRMVPPALVAGGVGAAALALHLRDPHEKGAWGLCPFAVLGFDCPGCGGLRAVNDLTHLRLLDAASSNLLLIVAAPVLLLGYARWSAARWRGERWEPSARAQRSAAITLAVLAVVFTALRNTTAGSWLAP